jgi:hypothetical protein
VEDELQVEAVLHVEPQLKRAVQHVVPASAAAPRRHSAPLLLQWM